MRLGSLMLLLLVFLLSKKTRVDNRDRKTDAWKFLEHFLAGLKI